MAERSAQWSGALDFIFPRAQSRRSLRPCIVLPTMFGMNRRLLSCCLHAKIDDMLARRCFLRLAGVAAASSAVSRARVSRYLSVAADPMDRAVSGGRHHRLGGAICWAQWLAASGSASKSSSRTSRAAAPMWASRRQSLPRPTATRFCSRSPPTPSIRHSTRTCPMIFSATSPRSRASPNLPLVLDVNPALPVNTVPEFIAYAKANPGKINFASFGARTISDLAIELLQALGRRRRGARALSGRRADADRSRQRPRPGRRRRVAEFAAAYQVRRRASAGGDVGETYADVAERADHGRNHCRLRGHGLDRRSACRAARHLPIVERLNREINAGLADPGIRARIAEVGGVPLVYSSAELRALIGRDAAKWAKVVEQAGIKPE